MVRRAYLVEGGDKEMAGRLRTAREGAGYKTAASAAQAMQIPIPTYSHHENGTRKLTPARALRYAKFFGVHPSWILYGRDDAKLSEEHKAALEQELEADDQKQSSLWRKDQVLKAGFNRLYKGAFALSPEFKSGDVGLGVVPEVDFSRRYDDQTPWSDWDVSISTPVAVGDEKGRRARFHVGYSDEPYREIAEYWMIPRNYAQSNFGVDSSELIIVKVDGDMMSPTLLSGDRVIVDKSRKDVQGVDGIYLISDVPSDPQIRRLRQVMFSEPRSILISCDNGAQEPQKVPADQVTVIGKVVGRISNL